MNKHYINIMSLDHTAWMCYHSFCFELCANQHIVGFLNEIVCIVIALKAAKLWPIKVGGKEIKLRLHRIELTLALNPKRKIFLSLHFDRSQPLELWKCIDAHLKAPSYIYLHILKNVASPLIHFNMAQSNLIYVVLI